MKAQLENIYNSAKADIEKAQTISDIDEIRLKYLSRKGEFNSIKKGLKDLTDEEKRNFPTPFLQALHNCDREIGKFVRKLTADPELYNDRTLIVITADHTATHGENFLKRKNFTPARIPLIFICRDQNIFPEKCLPLCTSAAIYYMRLTPK